MTNIQMTKRRVVEMTSQRPSPRWSFAIGIWSFPQHSGAVFANDAG
jgi:hypothetical protein